MAKEKKENPEVVATETVSTATNSGFDFMGWFNQNSKKVYAFLIGAAVGIGGFLAYKNMYVKPRQAEASVKIRAAQDLFARDSFERALNLPENGFLAVASDFGSTQAGNLARGYAGLCYLNMRKFDEAIQMLESFSPEGRIMPVTKFGALADAYSEKNDFGKALDLYKKAAQAGDVDDLKAMYLKRAGMLAQYKQKDMATALACYKEIKAKFPTTADGRDIEKYIAFAEASKK